MMFKGPQEALESLLGGDATCSLFGPQKVFLGQHFLGWYNLSSHAAQVHLYLWCSPNVIGFRLRLMPLLLFALCPSNLHTSHKTR